MAALLSLASSLRGPESAIADDKPSARPVDFDADVRPILERRCLECHGAQSQESGLRLDRRAAALRGGDSGVAGVVPGRSGESALWRRVSATKADEAMPPDGARLTAAQLTVLRRWIDEGAKWGRDETLGAAGTDHWSLQPIRRPTIPPAIVNDAITSRDDWDRNPIDRFVAARLSEKRLPPSPPTDRRTLLRRLWLDVLGLPPSPDNLAAFESDASPDAWERQVDRALASPHYGERWARHWLDVVRFAETDGFEMNQERPNAWRYRDWVIAALNDDIPFDRFLAAQVAGDQMGEPVATGFLVGGAFDKVKSPDIVLTLMQRQDEMADVINTAGTAFLGLTLGCARCHNHKFDPVTQVDYYALQAVFAGVAHGERPLPVDESPERARQRAAVQREISARESELKSLGLRPPVEARLNEERFEAVSAKFVRFTISATNTGSEPCLDEMEVFTAGEKSENVALASKGTKSTASGTLPGFDIHKLDHLHDGRYGNGRSWISNTPGNGWVMLEFAEPRTIDRVVWGRDREGKFADRVPTQYVVEVATVADRWTPVAASVDRLPFGSATPASTATTATDKTSNGGAGSVERARKATAILGKLAELRAELARLTAPAAMAYAGKFDKPAPTHRLYRGDPMSKREEIGPDTIAALGTLDLSRDASESERRSAFARWLVEPANPLVARVMANRVWQFHFGRGLVATPSDFGRNGVPPTHPELLDWLACELRGETSRGEVGKRGGRSDGEMERRSDGETVGRRDQTKDRKERQADENGTQYLPGSPSFRHSVPLSASVGGGSLKRLHRLILTSATYRQSSAPRTDGLDADAGSHLLWRFPPRRLEAETIRDCILTVSGALDERMEGPGFSAFEPNSNYVRVYNPKETMGPPEWRRMVYMTRVRMQTDGVFGVFDCPDAGQVAPQRARSTTPLQALNLLNSRFTLQQADLFAARVRERAVRTPVEQAFVLALGRMPEANEAHAATELVTKHGLAALCRALLNSNEFLFLP